MTKELHTHSLALLTDNVQADVITASIGGTNGFSDSPWAIVASRLVDKGVMVTIAAGNDGRLGPFLASNGAAGRNVLAVASVDASELAALPFQATFLVGSGTNKTTLGYLPGVDPWHIEPLPIVPLSLNVTIEDDACNALPDTTPDMSNAIVLVRRNTCSFSTQQANAQRLGAKHILIYNNDGPMIAPVTYDEGSAMAVIEAKAGVAIIETVKAGGNVTADFSVHGSFRVGIFNSAGGVPSIYTSWGPTYEMEVKPDIAAPGGSSSHRTVRRPRRSRSRLRQGSRPSYHLERCGPALVSRPA